jgi:hypothetical protein
MAACGCLPELFVPEAKNWARVLNMLMLHNCTRPRDGTVHQSLDDGCRVLLVPSRSQWATTRVLPDSVPVGLRCEPAQMRLSDCTVGVKADQDGKMCQKNSGSQKREFAAFECAVQAHWCRRTQSVIA